VTIYDYHLNMNFFRESGASTSDVLPPGNLGDLKQIITEVVPNNVIPNCLMLDFFNSKGRIYLINYLQAVAYIDLACQDLSGTQYQCTVKILVCKSFVLRLAWKDLEVLFRSFSSASRNNETQKYSYVYLTY
jgi:hypothetical protein